MWATLNPLSGVDFWVRACMKTRAFYVAPPLEFPLSVRSTFERKLQIFTHKFTPLSRSLNRSWSFCQWSVISLPKICDLIAKDQWSYCIQRWWNHQSTQQEKIPSKLPSENYLSVIYLLLRFFLWIRRRSPRFWCCRETNENQREVIAGRYFCK